MLRDSLVAGKFATWQFRRGSCCCERGDIFETLTNSSIFMSSVGSLARNMYRISHLCSYRCFLSSDDKLNSWVLIQSIKTVDSCDMTVEHCVVRWMQAWQIQKNGILSIDVVQIKKHNKWRPCIRFYWYHTCMTGDVYLEKNMTFRASFIAFDIPKSILFCETPRLLFLVGFYFVFVKESNGRVRVIL